MSTHNIGFYEDLTKIIFELSSNTHLISSAGSYIKWVLAMNYPLAMQNQSVGLFKCLNMSLVLQTCQTKTSLLSCRHY